MIEIFKYYPDLNRDMVISVEKDSIQNDTCIVGGRGINALFSSDELGIYGYFNTKQFIDKEGDYLEFGMKCYLRSVISEQYAILEDDLKKPLLDRVQEMLEIAEENSKEEVIC